MQEYESEFQAPDYSVVSRRVIGNKIITTVILEGEIAEFEADLENFVATKALEGLGE